MTGTAARQLGFTVTEVLATMALTAITASLAIPSMQSLMRESRQTTAANQMIASLHAARSAAMTRNAKVTLCGSRAGRSCDDPAWEHGWIAFTDTNGDGQRQAVETLLETAAATPGVTMRSSDFDGSLSFAGNGQVAELPENRSTARMTICDEIDADLARILVVNAVGKPRVHSAEPASSSHDCPASG